MSSMETMYENRNKMKNEQPTTQYVDHFTDRRATYRWKMNIRFTR